MSIKVMTLVWDRFPAAGSELLAMLALADWCSDDGGSLYPSIATLAKKIRVSESQARRLLHGLIADGYVSVIGNVNGGAPGTTRQYKVIVAKLKALPLLTPEDGETGSTDATPSADARGGMDARDGLHGCARRVAPMTPKPSLTVSKPSLKPMGYSPEFEEAWTAYPNRPGNSKADAFKAWNARLADKAKPATTGDMLAGVKRYAAYVEACGTEPQFVKQAATFFGPGMHFLSDWTAPPKVTPRNGRPSMNAIQVHPSDMDDDDLFDGKHVRKEKRNEPARPD